MSTASLDKAVALDVSRDDLKLDHTFEALPVLKLERVRLMDIIEAGGDGAAELAVIEAKIAEVSVEHDVLNAEHKIELLAANAEAVR